jgi:rhamnulokinase
VINRFLLSVEPFSSFYLYVLQTKRIIIVSQNAIVNGILKWDSKGDGAERALWAMKRGESPLSANPQRSGCQLSLWRRFGGEKPPKEREIEMKEFAAVDLGASNGRTILGQFNGKKLALSELNRFENNYIRVGDQYYWDVLRLYGHILEGLHNYAKTGGGQLAGIGIDTWGVDFGLIDRHGQLIGNPRAYRDPRGERGRKAFHAKYGRKAAFDVTGISNMDFNTLYQLYDAVQTNDLQLEIADRLLLMPDLLGYMLCGEATTEYTNATTTQMLQDGSWSKDILKMAGLPETLFARIQPSGEMKGSLFPFILQETGIKGLPAIYCIGSHDTASAVASIPAETENYAFISSGTWSLMGVILSKPVVNETVYANGFSNEGAVSGGVQLLKNIMGLWIIQNCKREWDTHQTLSWDDIVGLAGAAPAFRSFIDVDADVFYGGGNVPQKIQEYCRNTNQPVPQAIGEIARTVYESLAMSYRHTFEGLEELKGRKIDVLHILGGGSKNNSDR